MITVTASTANYYTVTVTVIVTVIVTSNQSNSNTDSMQDRLTTITSFFSGVDVDVTNNPDDNSLQESLKHTLIFASVAEDIGMPTKVIIHDFKGFKVEFTRQERTHPLKAVSVALTSLSNPLVTVTTSIEETIYLKNLFSS